MKVRKLLSVVVSMTIMVTMLLSFAIVSQAATVPASSTNAEIYVDKVSLDEGEWVVTYGFSSDDTLGITGSKKAGYSGIGICAFECTINILASTDPIYYVEMNNSVSANASPGQDMNGYYLFRWADVQAPANAIVSSRIATIYTKIGEAEKTEAEIIEMFSDIKFTTITIAYLDTFKGSAYTDDMMVNYGVGDDGATKYVDSAYVLTTPNNKVAPVDNTVTATPTLVGSGAAYLGASEGEYGSAFRIQFAKPSVATGELLDDVIFGVTPEGEARRYSPKQTGVLFGLSGDITLDVSFLNGSTAAGSYKKDGKAVSPKTITAVSVIMKDSEGNYYYSDANDANAAE